MSRNDDVEQAKNFVRRAENFVRKSGFDPDEIVTETDVENLAPMDRVYFLNLVLRKLLLAHILLSCEEPIPNPEDPDEYSSFKTNGTVLVVYEGGKPMWHMERHGEEWKNYCFHISFAHIEDVEYKRPERQFVDVLNFITDLKEVDNEVKERDSYFPNPFNGDGNYHFKKNENLVVAYRGDNPVWYLKRENDEWTTHKMIISREPMDFSIGALLQGLADGFEDFDELDED